MDEITNLYNDVISRNINSLRRCKRNGDQSIALALLIPYICLHLTFTVREASKNR